MCLVSSFGCSAKAQRPSVATPASPLRKIRALSFFLWQTPGAIKPSPSACLYVCFFDTTVEFQRSLRGLDRSLQSCAIDDAHGIVDQHLSEALHVNVLNSRKWPPTHMPSMSMYAGICYTHTYLGVCVYIYYVCVCMLLLSQTPPITAGAAAQTPKPGLLVKALGLGRNTSRVS